MGAMYGFKTENSSLFSYTAPIPPREVPLTIFHDSDTTQFFNELMKHGG
jgi:hypothetical protein